MKQVLFLLAVCLTVTFVTVSCASDDQEPDVSQVEFPSPEDILEPEYYSELSKGETQILIRTEVPKANVYLNKIYQGKTPLNITDLIPGYYLLTVESSDGEEKIQSRDYLIEVQDARYQNYYIQ